MNQLPLNQLALPEDIRNILLDANKQIEKLLSESLIAVDSGPCMWRARGDEGPPLLEVRIRSIGESAPPLRKITTIESFLDDTESIYDCDDCIDLLIEDLEAFKTCIQERIDRLKLEDEDS